MVPVIGSRITPDPTQVADNRGPVHTLQEEITPEMVAYAQHEYEAADRERKTAHQGHGVFHHGHKHETEHVEHQ